MFTLLPTFSVGPTVLIGYETVRKKHWPTNGRKEGEKLPKQGMKAVLSSP